ncbi:MAG TPA: efflux RND transporter permease subunit [Caulobacteraceae bacterium]|nr:efflux RND transporter permease subunit [Caulobacteraceae bacterium]
MLSTIVRWSLARAWFVAGLAAALFLAGLWYARTIPVEVFPTLAPAQMVVQTEAPGLVADQVEQIVTHPIEIALMGAPGLASVRSESTPGLSLITVRLARGADPARVRQAVAERLTQAAAALPAGAAASRIAPQTSATGDVLDIGFSSRTMDAMALRDLVQWTVRPQLLAASGVANVAVYGGRTRRIEVRARPGDLSDSDLGFLDVINAVQRATSVTGAGFIDTPEQRVLIDPRGQALTEDDVGAGQIQIVGSAPTRITDVADVVSAPAPAAGDALVQGRPGILVSVSGQYGAGVLQTTRAVQAVLAQLGPALKAQGVDVTVNPDGPARSLDNALRTLGVGLIVAVVVVAAILLVTLGDVRAVAALFFSIAPSLLAAVAALKALNLSLNIMTLGGLFIASAIVIDDAVIDIEAIVSALRAADNAREDRVQAIFKALLEVRAPVIYATLLIDIALTPILMLGGTAGPFLAPLAITIIVASLASLAVALCVTPASALLLLHGLQPRPEPALSMRLKTRYGRWIQRSGSAPGLALAAVGLAALGAAVILPLAKRTDAPLLHDGRLTVPIQAPPATSLDAMVRMGANLTRAALATPGVTTAFERIGRDPTDFSAASTDRANLELDLDPTLSIGAQDRVMARVQSALAGYPAVNGQVQPGLGLSQVTPEDQAPFAVSVYGQDLDQVDAVAGKIAADLRQIAGAGAGTGTVSVQAEPRAPAVRIDLNFKRLAIFGLSSADVLETVQTAFSGKTVAQVYRDGRPVDLTVTGPESLRRDPEGIGDLLLRSSSGLSTPLKAVANVYLTEARTLIQHQAGLRREVILAEVPPAQAAAFSRQARQAMTGFVAPPGTFLTYADANAAASQERRALAADSLLAGLAMIALLMLIFRNWKMALLILASSLFAFCGGAVAMLLTGDTLSLGAIAGFVALFGLSTRSAILLVSRPGDVVAARKVEWTLGVVKETAIERAAPILLTGLLVAAAVLPLAVFGRLGAEVLAPMAAVIIGGVISGSVLTLLFLPTLVHAYLCPFHSSGAKGGEHHHHHDHHGHDD